MAADNILFEDDRQHNLTKVTDALSNATEYEYNGLARLMRENPPQSDLGLSTAYGWTYQYAPVLGHVLTTAPLGGTAVVPVDLDRSMPRKVALVAVDADRMSINQQTAAKDKTEEATKEFMDECHCELCS